MSYAPMGETGLPQTHRAGEGIRVAGEKPGRRAATQSVHGALNPVGKNAGSQRTGKEWAAGDCKLGIHPADLCLLRRDPRCLSASRIWKF